MYLSKQDPGPIAPTHSLIAQCTTPSENFGISISMLYG